MFNSCPQCKNSDLHIEASVKAVLHSTKDLTGSIQLTLLYWDRVESVEHYECLNCGHIFTGENNN